MKSFLKTLWYMEGDKSRRNMDADINSRKALEPRLIEYLRNEKKTDNNHIDDLDLKKEDGFCMRGGYIGILECKKVIF